VSEGQRDPRTSRIACLEERQEQAKLRSLASNGTVARMMATMGYVCAALASARPRNALSHRPTARADSKAAQTKPVENKFKFGVVCTVMRDLGMIDE
jgi:hypothetical protein